MLEHSCINLLINAVSIPSVNSYLQKRTVTKRESWWIVPIMRWTRTLRWNIVSALFWVINFDISTSPWYSDIHPESSLFNFSDLMIPKFLDATFNVILQPRQRSRRSILRSDNRRHRGARQVFLSTNYQCHSRMAAHDEGNYWARDHFSQEISPVQWYRLQHNADKRISIFSWLTTPLRAKSNLYSLFLEYVEIMGVNWKWESTFCDFTKMGIHFLRLQLEIWNQNVLNKIIDRV